MFSYHFYARLTPLGIEELRTLSKIPGRFNFFTIEIKNRL